MSMEQRVTTLEEVSQTVIAALRSFNQSMRRYEAASARRDQAMLQAAGAIEQLWAALELSEESAKEAAAALEQQNEAVQALLTFVPVTQAEIVRLDSRIDRIEGG